MLLAVICVYEVQTMLHPRIVTGPVECESSRAVLPKNQTSRCRWLFVKYTPSPYEKYWTENIQFFQDNVCEFSNQKQKEVAVWIEQASSPLPLPEHVFSHFTFQNECTGEVSVDYIEPLAGLTRSPLFCLHGQNHVVDKDYLVVSWNMSKKLEPVGGYTPKAYYFDLGASLYDSGAGGASQKWFVETYEARGVQWDGIFAWEASNHAPGAVWELIPARLKPIYHWYNIPVSPEKGHPDNVVEYIRRIACPEDFVLVKLDIDATDVEEALVEQMLSDLTGLIDEFYFEHHVHTRPMFPYWGQLSEARKLADTYRIFSTFRKRGVVAHAWV